MEMNTAGVFTHPSKKRLYTKEGVVCLTNILNLNKKG